MRCYAVTERGAVDGLAVEAKPFQHVAVGEAGRGRRLVRVGLGRRDFAPEGVTRLESAGVVITRDRGTPLLVEGRPGDNRALVLVDIAAGYRGGTRWTGAERGPAEPCPLRGQEIPTWEAACGEASWTCRTCGERVTVRDSYVYTHTDEGEIRPWPAWDADHRIRLIAEGHRAQGAAGRMGGHVVRLLVMEPGASFRALRRGRLYGASSEVFVRHDHDGLHVGSYDEVFGLPDESSGEEV